MSKELKLEVGKRYAMEGGDVVFIFRVDLQGDFHGTSPGSGVRYWRPNGSSDQFPAIVRCLDDEPELVDLTKIDVPLGELDERTQDRLAGAHVRGATLEVRVGGTFLRLATGSKLSLDPGAVYRLKPEEPTYTMPTVDDKVWLALPGAKSITWDSGATNPYAHAKSNPDKVEHYGQWIDGDELPANLLGDLIKRGDCPWDQAIVLRPEGL